MTHSRPFACLCYSYPRHFLPNPLPVSTRLVCLKYAFGTSREPPRVGLEVAPRATFLSRYDGVECGLYCAGVRVTRHEVVCFV